MRISKNDIPVKVDAPGAVARQQQDFGDASGYGHIGAEYFTMVAGPISPACSRDWRVMPASLRTGAT